MPSPQLFLDLPNREELPLSSIDAFSPSTAAAASSSIAGASSTSTAASSSTATSTSYMSLGYPLLCELLSQPRGDVRGCPPFDASSGLAGPTIRRGSNEGLARGGGGGLRDAGDCRVVGLCDGDGEPLREDDREWLGEAEDCEWLGDAEDCEWLGEGDCE